MATEIREHIVRGQILLLRTRPKLRQLCINLAFNLLGDFLRFSFFFDRGGSYFSVGGIMSRLIFRLPTQCSQIK